MAIILVRFGKVRSSFLQKTEAHYLELLQKMKVPIEIRTLRGKDDKQTDTQLIVEKYQGQSNVFLLTESGKGYSSLTFSKLLAPALITHDPYYFIIGGPFGWEYQLLPQNFKLISLSSLTFPHELAYVVLLEQIYRANKIVKGQEYHY